MLYINKVYIILLVFSLKYEISSLASKILLNIYYMQTLRFICHLFNVSLFSTEGVVFVSTLQTSSKCQ